ncbi:MAG: hypothetical protein B6I17_00935 [Tenericutes bacterium 4572_104]|nr:MAG: hypothetical protein B6I17_00935 [Tenericutes bacterium 4572_104]
MKDIQKRILDETEKLITSLDFTRMSVLAIISSISVLIVFKWIDYPVTWQFAILVLIFAYLYALIRDVIIVRKTKKTLKIYYDFSFSKRSNIQLFIPIFSKSNQVYTLKRASLFIADDTLYLEAYKRSSLRSKLDNSVVARYNKDFFIDKYSVNKSGKYIEFETRILYKKYYFSMINDEELLEIIQKYKEN